MAWFTRKKEPDGPAVWGDLWTALAGLNPRLLPEDVQAWRARAVALGAEVLGRATNQLARAYALFDTEQRARYAPVPFTEPGRPFAYSDFLRTIDAVIVAGPDAAAQLASDPEALRAFRPLQPAEGSPYFTPVAYLRPLLVLLATVRDEATPRADRTDVFGTRSTLTSGVAVPASWPSLGGDSRRVSEFITNDPSCPWWEIEVEFDDPEGVGTFDGWEASAARVADRMVRVLGPRAGEVAPGLRQVLIEVVADEDAAGIGDEADDLDPDDPAGLVRATVILTGPERAAPQPVDREAVLTGHAARVLLRQRVSDAARATLEGLAAAPA